MVSNGEFANHILQFKWQLCLHRSLRSSWISFGILMDTITRDMAIYMLYCELYSKARTHRTLKWN